jgi:hypothetical protein
MEAANRLQDGPAVAGWCPSESHLPCLTVGRPAAGLRPTNILHNQKTLEDPAALRVPIEVTSDRSAIGLPACCLKESTSSQDKRRLRGQTGAWDTVWIAMSDFGRRSYCFKAYIRKHIELWSPCSGVGCEAACYGLELVSLVLLSRRVPPCWLEQPPRRQHLAPLTLLRKLSAGVLAERLAHPATYMLTNRCLSTTCCLSGSKHSV